jgi:hypothetical protein
MGFHKSAPRPSEHLALAGGFLVVAEIAPAHSLTAGILLPIWSLTEEK